MQTKTLTKDETELAKSFIRVLRSKHVIVCLSPDNGELILSRTDFTVPTEDLALHIGTLIYEMDKPRDL